MADLTNLQATLPNKIIGSDSTGLETNPVMINSNNALQTIPPLNYVTRTGLGATGTPNTEASLGPGMTSATTTNVQCCVKGSANDIVGGTGIQTVRLTYLDQSFNGPFTEIISLNGTTVVPTVATNICYIDNLEPVTGTILGTSSMIVYLNTTGTGLAAYTFSTGAIITGGIGSHWIPANKTCYITGIAGSTANQSGTATSAQGGKLLLKYQLSSQPFIFSVNQYTYTIMDALRMIGTGSSLNIRFRTPIAIQGPARVGLNYIYLDGVLSSLFAGSFSYYEI